MICVSRTGSSASGAKACENNVSSAGPVHAPFRSKSERWYSTSPQMRAVPSTCGIILSRKLVPAAKPLSQRDLKQIADPRHQR
jgi:hypothetical protein